MDRGQVMRSVSNRRIAGVAGGIAEYFNVDPVLVRIGFVIGALMGWGILLYVILWVVMPQGSSAGPPAAASPRGRSSPAVRIAEERFARGEISGEDLERIRQDLTRGP